MTDELDILIKHIKELSQRAARGGYYTYTDFLGLGEMSAVRRIERELPVKYAAYGGSPDAERVILAFGDENELGFSPEFPIRCIKIEPLMQKYADKLTHRDFLGAILNLGIERAVIGDIIIKDNVGYAFVLSDMADFVISEIKRIKHTDVKACEVFELPEGELYKTEQKRITLEGERLDSIVAKVFSLSRSDAQLLFKRGLVFADGREIISTSYTPKPDEKISVRGHGRFIYRGPSGNTRKGKLAVTVDLYV